jgi:chromosomal replication initiator protein
VALWTKAEVDFLRECALAKISVKSLVPFLGRSAASIRMKRFNLGLPPCVAQKRLPEGTAEATVAEIKRVVAEHFGIPLESMTSADRSKPIARPRQVAMFFAREVGRKSYPNIGRLFGNRDHTTVLHAARQVERLMGEDDNFKDEVTTIRGLLVSNTSKEEGVCPQNYPSSTHFPAFAENRAGA